MSIEIIFWAFFGGIVPALLWLDFWLHEDRKHPEPRNLVARTFLLGMLAVLFVLPLQKGTDVMMPGLIMPAIIIWAILEELFKFIAGWLGGMRTNENDEPIDQIIYMITAALGFVALENTLFILGPLADADIAGSVITGNLRFIGASLLHIVSSGIIGSAMAFSFYKSRKVRVVYIRRAIVAAVIFHVLFNVLILKFGGTGTILAFSAVWVGAIGLLWAFERAKKIAPR